MGEAKISLGRKDPSVDLGRMALPGSNGTRLKADGLLAIRT